MIGILTSKAFWILVGLVMLAAGSWYTKGVFEERDRLRTENATLKATAAATKELQRSANQAESAMLDRLRAGKEESDERAKKLDSALKRANGQLASCRIDADTLRVLNDGHEQRAGSTGSPSGPQPSTADVEASAGGSTCEALAITFNENHGRFQQLRDQVIGWQAFYADLLEKYCKATKAC